MMEVARTHHSTLAVGISLGQLVIAVQSMTVLSDLDLSWMEPIRTVLNIVAVGIFKVDLLNLSCHVEDSNTTTHLACKLLIFPVMVLMMCVICTILKRILRIKWYSNNIMNSVGMLSWLIHDTDHHQSCSVPMLGESQRNARNICPIGQTAPITTRWWSAGLLELSGACWHFLLQIVIDVPLTGRQ